MAEKQGTILPTPLLGGVRGGLVGVKARGIYLISKYTNNFAYLLKS